ncbi:signal recognition particle 9 kDa protein-domain-containing protein [Tirmania nivea]|nr:signal recognition particle 9 kDa protein-domain-containing protein [Tirmania nivea]
MHISPTPQDFLDQSLLLIQARPKTTRITTTYSTTNPTLRAQKSALWLAKKGKPTPPTTTTTSTPATTQHTAHLTIKTYDPVSGTTIQFVTREVRDVGRLVGVLGRAARGMGGVKIQPQAQPDTVMSDAPVPTQTPTPTSNQAVLAVAAAETPRVGSPAPTPARVGTPGPGGEKQQQQQQVGGSGGGQGKGKKKKGKK